MQIRLSACAVLFLLLFAGCSAGSNGTGASTTTSTTTTTTSTDNSPVIVANLQPYANSTGSLATYSTGGSINESVSFFQPLGTNGRTCASCHQLSQGMSISPASIQALFSSSKGSDPLFAAVDGANYPTAGAGDSASRSLLLNYGLIRVAITLPKGAQFTITTLQDPYGCALEVNGSGQQVVSVYRRPLPATGLDYLSNVMWDTRETGSALTAASSFSTSLSADLNQQMLDAVSTHQQGTTTPTAVQIAEVLSLEQGLYTAQATDNLAGSLSANGATGGPSNLAAVNYYPGINDAFGGDPQGRTFSPNVFTLYDAWRGSTNPQQASINRGQNIFNTAPLAITNVSGINDNAALGSPQALRGSCSTCHDTPNAGSHSLPLVMDTGTGHIAANEADAGVLAGLAQLSAPDLPVFQITGCKDANNRPVTYVTSDPGKALVTGLCADVSRMKVPSLRGLAARAPYFHGGTASSLAEVVSFYNARFNMRLSAAQQADLVAFLGAL